MQTKIKKPYRVYAPIKLTPRGALSRPPRSHLSIEVWRDKPEDYPAVHITREAHGKIRALVAACPVEVSWLSPTKVLPNGDVLIYDALVPHQVCTTGSTAKLKTVTLDGEDQLLSELMTARKFDMIRDLICWGHSHVHAGTWASGPDEDQTWDFVKRMRDMGKTRFVRLIANKGDDLFASLYLIDESRAIHHAPIMAEPPDTEAWEAWAHDEIVEKVVQPIYKPIYTRFFGAEGEEDDFEQFGDEHMIPTDGVPTITQLITPGRPRWKQSA